MGLRAAAVHIDMAFPRMLSASACRGDGGGGVFGESGPDDVCGAYIVFAPVYGGPDSRPTGRLHLTRRLIEASTSYSDDLDVSAVGPDISRTAEAVTSTH